MLGLDMKEGFKDTYRPVYNRTVLYVKEQGCTRLTAGFGELNWQPQINTGQLQFSVGLFGSCLHLLGGFPSWVRYSYKPTAICMWIPDWDAGFVTSGISKRSDTGMYKQHWFLLLCTHCTGATVLQMSERIKIFLKKTTNPYMCY